MHKYTNFKYDDFFTYRHNYVANTQVKTYNIYFFNFFKHLFIFERQSVRGGETEREGDTESEAGSRIWAVSTEPDAGLKFVNHKIMTWAKVRCPTYWATQEPQDIEYFHKVRQGIPIVSFVPIPYLFPPPEVTIPLSSVITS